MSLQAHLRRRTRTCIFEVTADVFLHSLDVHVDAAECATIRTYERVPSHGRRKPQQAKALIIVIDEILVIIAGIGRIGHA
jgi:hypothetical protein